ncbi:MAG: glycosyltransferase [Acidimicrobiia bacterium]
MADPRIPRIAHFVFGMRPQDEPFHLVHYLAIASCLEVVRPDEVFVHCAELPYGAYWDLIRPHVTLHRVGRVAMIDAHEYETPIAPFSYAHHADFVRLDALATWGGLYADIDTLFVTPLPDDLWDEPAVIGREADVADERTGVVRRRRRARWSCRNRVDGSSRSGAGAAPARSTARGRHGCFLGYDLATELTDDVRLEPVERFHRFAPTPDGIADMLEHDVTLDGVCSMHLMAHLWWSETRRDFTAVHARTIDEQWIAAAPVTYAKAARRFLPGLS